MRQIIFGALLIISIAMFIRTVRLYLKVMLRGRSFPSSFDQKGKRLTDILVYFLGQTSVFREWASRHHLLIFWGFLIITVGTVELLIQGLVPTFSYASISPFLDQGFKFVLDVTNAIVLIVMAWAFIRRLILRPELIPLSSDAALILGMIAALCLTHFGMHGLRSVASGEVPSHLPISAAFAGLLQGIDSKTALWGSAVNFWIHVGIVLFFLNYIPYSKHIHILGSLPNIALRNRGPKGRMPKLNLEDEKDWGVSCYEGFTWKSLLDTYACTECARCSINCPAWRTQKPLSPMQLIHDIRTEMLDRGKALIQLTPGVMLEDAGQGDEPEQGQTAAKPTPRDIEIQKALKEMPPLVGGRIKDETLWACVTCGACEAVCPVFIEHPLKILQMRSHLVLAESRMPTELARMFRGIENNLNPWGIGADQRMDWAKGLDVPIMEEKEEAEYLVWIGCVGSYDDRAKKVSRAWVQLLQQAGVDFAVLGLEEGCTGDPARRAGNEFLFQMMVESNLELFQKYKVQKILVTCPHCYHCFKNEYPAFGGQFEVWHHTQFIERLLQEGKLLPTQPISSKLVYHDSCYLGRWNNIYESPRTVLAAACGGKRPEEMPHTGYKSFCCGAGGAHLWMEEKSPRINEKRTEEALNTGADTIATACPYCMVMLSDGMKAKNKEEEVRVLDVAEVLFESLAGQEPKAKEV